MKKKNYIRKKEKFEKQFYIFHIKKEEKEKSCNYVAPLLLFFFFLFIHRISIYLYVLSFFLAVIKGNHMDRKIKSQ